jgi:hypothetical protein
MKKRPQSNETGSTAEAEPAPDDAVPKIRRQKRGQSKKARKENALTEWLKSLGVAVLLFVVMRTFVLQTFVRLALAFQEPRGALRATLDPVVARYGSSTRAMKST